MISPSLDDISDWHGSTLWYVNAHSKFLTSDREEPAARRLSNVTKTHDNYSNDGGCPGWQPFAERPVATRKGWFQSIFGLVMRL